MVNITGGGISISTISIIAVGITFITGILDGILRPLGCRE